MVGAPPKQFAQPSAVDGATVIIFIVAIPIGLLLGMLRARFERR